MQINMYDFSTLFLNQFYQFLKTLFALSQNSTHLTVYVDILLIGSRASDSNLTNAV